MLAVAFIALAIPLAVLILGVKGFSAKPAAPLPEAPGLRASLEHAALRAMQPPAELGPGCRRFVLLSGQGNSVERQKSLERSVLESGGTSILLGQVEGGSRLLVQIPAAAADRFEAVALAGFSCSSTPDRRGNTCLYEIVLPPP